MLLVNQEPKSDNMFEFLLGVYITIAIIIGIIMYFFECLGGKGGNWFLRWLT